MYDPEELVRGVLEIFVEKQYWRKASYRTRLPWCGDKEFEREYRRRWWRNRTPEQREARQKLEKSRWATMTSEQLEKKREYQREWKRARKVVA